jgi:hypothetical protein
MVKMMIMTMKQVLNIGEERKWRWKQTQRQRYMQKGFVFTKQGAIECTVEFMIDRHIIKRGISK